jgi:GNAT superfamily N-acetyltransferase
MDELALHKQTASQYISKFNDHHAPPKSCPTMNTPAELPALRIDAEDPVGETAQNLISDLCAEMSSRYGAPPSPFSLSEAAVPRSVFLVARLHGEPIGCGALRQFDDDTAEIKRVYVAPAGRRRGVARQIVAALETFAIQQNYRNIRLETGVRQPEAQRLYQSMGFQQIDAFGPYIGNPTSVCFEKVIPVRAHSPEAVVQRQLDAYNARDIDALLATYSDDAQIFEYPATLLASGRVQLRERFCSRFAETNLHAHLLRRTVMGHIVIDQESVTRTFPEGAGTIELIAIYEVREGRISAARFINGLKNLQRA